MRFETIKYVEWIRTRQGVKIDLCRSGTENFSLKDLNLNWEGLEIFGENAYGYHPLLEAVASRYKVREENVVTTIGASHALFLACAALLARGDEVLVEKPAYEPLLAVPAAMEAKILRFERRFEEGFQVDVKEFESLLSSKTKLVILSNLHNPSGTLLSRSLLNNLAGIAQKKGVRILVDEIYLEFLEGPEKESSYSLADNIIVISSLTKVYGLGGLRCGWILAPAELAKRIRAVIDYTNIDGVFIGEQISARIFSQLDSINEKNKELVGQNREMIRDFIQEEERLKWVEPAGGVVCFPKVEAGLSGDSLAALLQEKYRTSVVPGSFFEEPQHFRLGFGVAPSILASALKYIKKVLEQF
jgi:hypothetical protein